MSVMSSDVSDVTVREPNRAGLAAALALKCERFWRFARKASKLAKREGLKMIGHGLFI